jgi:hypothetical protein
MISTKKNHKASKNTHLFAIWGALLIDLSIIQVPLIVKFIYICYWPTNKSQELKVKVVKPSGVKVEKMRSHERHIRRHSGIGYLSPPEFERKFENDRQNPPADHNLGLTKRSSVFLFSKPLTTGLVF